jgi:hypothetical protein
MITHVQQTFGKLDIALILNSLPRGSAAFERAALEQRIADLEQKVAREPGSTGVE